MKLDFDVLSVADTRLNPIGDRELILRSLKIQAIENLAMTKDQNDTIDLTDNELRKLENFPKMTRLQNLLLANNRISKIDPEITTYVPNLKSLILTNNQFQELGDLDPIAGFKKLEYLSLVDNPVALKKHYRLYLIHRCPNVRIVDFRRVKLKERHEAAKLFSGVAGRKLEASYAASTTELHNEFEVNNLPKNAQTPYQGPTPEQAAKIKEAIAKAKTLDEVTRLEAQLRGGVVPDSRKKKGSSNAEDVEMDSD
ncbi:U2 small nuclear ribonucleoprotein A' [Nowakowskiella sp. JEL0407]|nr:U2 small nuclear ribonucleoprotein A' [Nowakowskiella sp. JEL0407]